MKFYIDSIDKGLFFTKKDFPNDADRLIGNIYIQFGYNIKNKYRKEYSVSRFTWSLKARKEFFYLNEAYLKKLQKSRHLAWLELDMFPKDKATMEELDEFSKEFFSSKKKRVKKEVVHG